MKRIKANDGCAIFVQGRAASDPFASTDRRSATAPKSWFDVKLKTIQNSKVDFEEEAWSRMKAWVEDQKLIAFGGYLLMEPQYELRWRTLEIAQERRRRFHEQARHQRELSQVRVLQERACDAAEQRLRTTTEEVIGGSLGGRPRVMEGPAGVRRSGG
ncbi:hypothetical protein PG984_015234 [Apiospora sp. TS-2023a]